MLSINPAHIVNYKLNADTGAPLIDEAERKILAISQAKLIYILYNHDSNSVNYKLNLIVRENIIKDNYQENSVILVEEDSEIKKFNLRCNWFVKLNPFDYRVKGWDNHIACQNYANIYARKDVLYSAIEKITLNNQALTSQIESWNILKEFTTTQNSYLSENDINSFVEKKLSSDDLRGFERKKLLFFLQCQTDIEQSKISCIYDSFQIRQDSLFQKIEKNLQKGRKVIVLCGKNHGNPTDIKLIPIVAEHLSRLTVPFIVVNP
ncbi:MAG: hypothetical protein H0T62_09505 [Parachlamydiaceae bacterium]|nr:hypothetical protein [Parachlamydiaceae bacterium]